jgi:hypothetical protein
MRRILAITAVFGVGADVRVAAVRSILARPGATPPASAAKGAYVALPLRFEPNVGQADDGDDFLSRGRGFALLMTRTGAVLKLRNPLSRTRGVRPDDGQARRAGGDRADVRGRQPRPDTPVRVSDDTGHGGELGAESRPEQRPDRQTLRRACARNR